MKFDLDCPVKVVMLGAGGTGGHIAPHLFRLLYALDRPVRFIIADGDTVEPKNLVRQNFTQADLGQNKARVLAERYSAVFGLETEYVPHYVEDEAALSELVTPENTTYKRSVGPAAHEMEGEELVILIGAVDNNRSRQLCHRVFHTAQELIYIDSGNGEYTGQVVCGVRRGGHTLFRPVGGLYPELMEPTDLFPSEVSCADHNLSAPQTIAANLMAATAVVTLVYNILVVGESSVRQTTFSTKIVNLRSMLQKTKGKGAGRAKALGPKTVQIGKECAA